MLRMLAGIFMLIDVFCNMVWVFTISDSFVKNAECEEEIPYNEIEVVTAEDTVSFPNKKFAGISGKRKKVSTHLQDIGNENFVRVFT